MPSDAILFYIVSDWKTCLLRPPLPATCMNDHANDPVAQSIPGIPYAMQGMIFYLTRGFEIIQAPMHLPCSTKLRILLVCI